MIEQFRSLFTPPEFHEVNRARIAELLSATQIISVVVIILLLFVLVMLDATHSELIITSLGLVFLVFASSRLLKRGQVKFASVLLLGGFWLATAQTALLTGGGPLFPDAELYVLFIVAAGLLLDGRAALLFAGINIAFRLLLLWLDTQGLLPATTMLPAAFYWLSEFIAYTIVAWYLGLASANLEKAFAKNQRDQAALNASNQALQAREEFMRQITDNVQGLIAYVDSQERFRFANSTYARWFRRPLDQIIGHTIRELVGDEIYLSRQHRHHALRGEKYTFEDTYSYPDGVTRTVLGSYTPHLNTSGDVLGFYIFVFDISERKEAELRNARLFQQLRHLNQQVATTQESERKAIAQELHDSIGQNLTAIGLNLNILRVKLSAHQVPTELLLERIDDAQQLVQQTAQQVRNVLRELRPPLLQEEGLLAALHSLAATISQRTGLLITVAGCEPTPRLTEATALGLFRVTQEALTNVLKHAQATHVQISLTENEEGSQLTIGDNGRGLELVQAENQPDQPNWGMLTMRERSEAIGGMLQIDSVCGEGTTISVKVPR